jgi:hypothetical protein
MAKKWMQKARTTMEKKGTVGSLHSATGTPQGQKIPLQKVEAAAHSDNPKMRKKGQFALNVRK